MGSINTQGQFTGVISTQQAGETAQEWMDRHLAGACAAITTGNSLTTNWTSGGQPQSVSTTRNRGESFSAFWDRHAGEVSDEAADHPPE